ncbi:hypothetical protein EDD86DRAFT_246628 [Gorgonomyces haynaldii]|nr:hypothetical protein EDD86DRAFT_246628 [Gorgonomyces haynaldii]
MIDYESFVTKLKTPSGDGLRKQFQLFLNQFSQVHGLPSQRRFISTFLKQIIQDSLQSDTFKENDQVDEENVKEGWEKLVLSQVFDRIFVVGEEAKANVILQQKMTQFSWIQEKHLDIPIQFSLKLEVASAELLKVNGYKAPRDKLVVMQNVMQIVVDLISKSNAVANQDILLPTLILVIVRANPANMISNIKYMGAVSFIYNMTNQGMTEKAKERLVNPEMSRITNQVSGFFSNLFKEVKTLGSQAADEIVANLSTPSANNTGNGFESL